MNPLILLYFLVLFDSTLNIDYCTVCKTHLKEHTMCKYGPKCPVVGLCSKEPQTPFTDAEKAVILDIHNQMRNNFSMGIVSGVPTAADMLELEWNTELETIAQCWANQCKFEHDTCRDIDKGRVGQNLAMHGNTVQNATHSENTFTTLLQKWYEEYKNFKSGNFEKFAASDMKAGPTGHFTQLVWAKTQYVGCGRVFYQEAMKGRTFYMFLLVCNYFPGGNTLTLPIYTTGKPASKCPDGTKPSTIYKGLCTEKSK